MTQIVDNWALLECRLINITETGPWLGVRVIVEKSEMVPGFPNLIQPSADPVTIRLKTPLNLGALTARFRISARRSAPAVLWGDASTIVPVH